MGEQLEASEVAVSNMGSGIFRPMSAKGQMLTDHMMHGSTQADRHNDHSTL